MDDDEDANDDDDAGGTDDFSAADRWVETEADADAGTVMSLCGVSCSVAAVILLSVVYAEDSGADGDGDEDAAALGGAWMVDG